MSSSQQKKQSTIVHKPFQTGQVNIFMRPKANPNGRLASAKLLTKDTKKRPNNFLLEQITKQTENYLNSWPLDNPSAETSPFSRNKTIFIAITIVLLANIVSAVIIFNQRQKTQLAEETIIEPESSLVGNIDLSSKEFIDLKASSLSTIPQANLDHDLSVDEPKVDPVTTLPLAIPPLNIARNTPLATQPSLTQYYYILSEYTGDHSLAKAREKVPNVSLITLEEGMFIYMGAFGRKELAQEFLRKLKQEGFYAYIYPSD